jgi:hypothetical protein
MDEKLEKEIEALVDEQMELVRNVIRVSIKSGYSAGLEKAKKIYKGEE